MAPETNSAVERLEAHAHLRQDHEESEKQEQGRKAQAFPETKGWCEHLGHILTSAYPDQRSMWTSNTTFTKDDQQ